jgi:hypothetical protein
MNARPLLVSPSICRGQSMTVRAEEAQIAKAVVVPSAIPVFQFKWDRSSQPFSQMAVRAAMIEDFRCDQTPAQSVGSNFVGAILNEIVCKRSARRQSRQAPVPRLPREVAGIQAMFLYQTMDRRIAAALGCQTKAIENLSDGRGCGNGCDDVRKGIASARHHLLP